MNLTGFTYHITVDAVETELFPHFAPDAVTLEFEDTVDDDFGFYRKVLQTPLSFKGASYDFLLALEDLAECEAYDFDIRYNGVDKFSGLIRFCTGSMQWDRSKCRVTVKIDSRDDYACLIDGWEEEINILTGTTKVEVGYFAGTLVYTECEDIRISSDPDWEDFETPEDDCITGEQGWTLYQHVVVDGGATRTWTSSYVREEITVACSGGVPVPPPGDGWLLEDDNCPTDALYVRPLVQGTASPVDEGDHLFSIEYEIAGISGDGVTIDNGVRLDEVLETFNPCAGNIISDFFSINPDASYPSGSSAYTEALANLADVVIFQKSDVKRPAVASNATNGKWTFKEILESLKVQFNVEPRIIAGDLRLEHVSYWEEASNGLDLTAGAYAERIAGLHAYTYDTETAAKSEKWVFMDRCSLAFEGIPIYYNTYPDGAQAIEYPVSKVTNDVPFISENPDSIQDEGFVFVNAYDTGSGLVLVSETNAYITTQSDINGHMSIPNLLDHYHRWKRMQPTGTMNGDPVTFESSIRRKAQVPISIKLSVDDYFDMDPSERINTQMGWGKIESMSYSAASCTLTLTIRHE